MVSEQVLIRRAVHRDQRAFDQLYERYHAQIYGIVASRARDRDDVDDLV